MYLKINKLKPMFTGILTTMNHYEEDVTYGDSGLIKGNSVKGKMKEYQTVLAVGDSVRGIKVGDMVMIDPKNYRSVKQKEKDNQSLAGVIEHQVDVTYHFNVVDVNEQPCLLLDDRDIMFVFEGEEVSEIIQDKPKIIV